MILMAGPGSDGGSGLLDLFLWGVIALIIYLLYLAIKKVSKKFNLSGSRAKVAIGVVLIILSIVSIIATNMIVMEQHKYRHVDHALLNQVEEIVNLVGGVVGAVGLIFLLVGLMNQNLSQSSPRVDSKNVRHLNKSGGRHKCKKCGHLNPLDDKFCGSCGDTLENSSINT